FAYPKGPLDGQGPPLGSPPGQGGWSTSNGNPRVEMFGLDFAGIFSTGGNARIRGVPDTNGDKVTAQLGPVTADEGVVWVGFLVRRAKGTDPLGYAVVSLGNNVTGPSLGIGLLFTKKVYGLDNNTGKKGSRSTSEVAPSGETVWLVTKLDFNGAHEYLWINPSPGTEPDIADADAELNMTAEFLAAGFSEVVLQTGYARQAFDFDELRIGTTFADVVNR
ncbi:MAG: hypothetical protein ABIR38_00355, partial [Chthoniobacterales bacterium]